MTDEPSLNSLIRWFQGEVADAIPIRIHNRDTDDGGAPQWHGAFKAWLYAHPGATDEEGYILSPLRYWIDRLGQHGRAGKRARYCWLLASVAYDWRLAALINGIDDEDAAHDYSRATLLRLRQLMYDAAGTPNQPVVTKRGECAEKGCVNKTSHYRCRDHEKSESQYRAEEAAA